MMTLLMLTLFTTQTSKYDVLEKKHVPLKDKLKTFLEKNIEITNQKREVEDRIRQVNGDNYKLVRRCS